MSKIFSAEISKMCPKFVPPKFFHRIFFRRNFWELMLTPKNFGGTNFRIFFCPNIYPPKFCQIRNFWFLEFFFKNQLSSFRRHPSMNDPMINITHPAILQVKTDLIFHSNVHLSSRRKLNVHLQKETKIMIMILPNVCNIKKHV